MVAPLFIENKFSKEYFFICETIDTYFIILT